MGGSRERMDGDAAGQPAGLPRFTPEFIAEVDRCEDVDSFRDLLVDKGLWLNRWAAIDVFAYLRGLPVHDGAIGDEQLAAVTGGVDVPSEDLSALMPVLMEIVREL